MPAKWLGFFKQRVCSCVFESFLFGCFVLVCVTRSCLFASFLCVVCLWCAFVVGVCSQSWRSLFSPLAMFVAKATSLSSTQNNTALKIWPFYPDVFGFVDSGAFFKGLSRANCANFAPFFLHW